jgi:hypothetical protein
MWCLWPTVVFAVKLGVKTSFSKCVLGAAAGIALAVIGLFGLSRYDALIFGKATFARVDGVSFVSAHPSSRHLLVVPWRMEPRGPNDLPGEYLVWTLRPFRSVTGFK